MSKLSTALTIGAILATIPAYAALHHEGAPDVGFRAVGPGGLAFNGTSHDLSVTEKGTAAIFTTKLDTLTTGIDLRDSHMKEKYLETAKYPTAVLSVERAKLHFPQGHGSGDVTGTLTLHGQTHPVVVHYEANGTATSATFEGTFTVNMHQFGIEVPTYLGVTVKPNVAVTVKTRLVEK